VSTFSGFSNPIHHTQGQMAMPGILGGLGPLAHIEFERRLLAKNSERGACRDQDHPIWLLMSASNIPDRTLSLSGQVEDCTPWLVRYARLLERAGVNFLVVPCNTAHAFYDRVQPQIDIPWLHLMKYTSQHIVETYPQVKRVGILATDGTLRTELYTQSLLEVGLTPVAPPLNSAMQKQVMQAIYHPEWGIKAAGIWISEPTLEVLRQSVIWMKKQGAELIIAGCTELSVGLARLENLPLPWVDPLDVAADVTLDLAFGTRKLRSGVAA
jgi:aspartate racemase